MKLIVGLGNPGSRYQLTRHNAGFMILDYFARELGVTFKAGKGDWESVEAEYMDTRFYLMKPATFMNRSGMAVKDFMELHKIEPSDIFVIYDDFQIPLGTIRIRIKGSDGGHNGIADIIYNIESMEFPRMRFGIGTDATINQKTDGYTGFVLSNFTTDELDKLKILAPFAKDAIQCYLDEGIYAAMNKYNRNYFDDEKKSEISDDSDKLMERK